ncbi:MAG: type I-C CRISPR-associated protein Cas5c [Bacillota bacterium]
MKYNNSVSFEVHGDYALFSDPTTSAGGEKSSLQIPTYEALKGILHSIYWKPTITWIIDEVRIMNQIQTESKGIRPIKYGGGNDLSFYTYLKTVRYQVKAHFIWNENRPELTFDRNEHKHFDIAKRTIAKGGRRDIFLGTRECQGYVESCEFGEGTGAYDGVGELAFGLTYHGITYPDEAYSEETKNKMTMRYFYPVMKKGVISFLKPEECTVTHVVKEMEMKKFGKGENFAPVEELEESHGNT